MKQYISCNMETLSVPGETAWIISIPAESAPDAALLLAALLYGKVHRVKFTDKACAATLSAADYVLCLNGEQIRVTGVWLEGVVGMLLDVCLHGWTDTAHLDQDFGEISITVAVLPPER